MCCQSCCREHPLALVFGCLGWVPHGWIATRLRYAHLGTGQPLSPKGLFCTEYLTLGVSRTQHFPHQQWMFSYTFLPVCWVSLSNTDVSFTLKQLPEAIRIKSTPCSEVRSGSGPFWRHWVSSAPVELPLGHSGGEGSLHQGGCGSLHPLSLVALHLPCRGRACCLATLSFT